MSVPQVHCINDVATKRGGADTAGIGAKSEKKSDPMSVAIDPRINEMLSEWCARRRAVKREIVAAVLDRFLAMPPAVQTAFINTVDQGMEGHYAEVLRDMAKLLEIAAKNSNAADKYRIKRIGDPSHRTPKESDPPPEQSSNQGEGGEAQS